VYGEGNNTKHGSARSLIEGNYVFGAYAVGIYLDAAPNATVRRNIVVGTSNPEFWRSSRSVGAGIVLNNETYHYAANGGDLPATVQSRHAKIYGNLVAGTSHGLGFWGQFDQSTFDDVVIFNNTFVENETQLVLREKPKSGAKFVNNILLSIGSDNRDVDRTSAAGLVARSNYFSRGSPGGDFNATNNVVTGLVLARMSGWRAVNQASEISWRDFEIRAGSRGIGSGDEEPRSMSQGDNTYDRDYNSLPHNNAMDLGALHFSETPVTTPKKPVQIRATP
jgi:parallel beta-helix repeat protein